MDTLSKNLRARLQQLKMTQVEFAEQVGISQPKADFCLDLAEFGLQPEYVSREILFFSKEQKPEINRVAIYKIKNKYGWHVVMGKYYEVMGAPNLKACLGVEDVSWIIIIIGVIMFFHGCNKDVTKTPEYKQGYAAGQIDQQSQDCSVCRYRAENDFQGEVCDYIC